MIVVKNSADMKNPAARRRGRPPAFDRETVLSAARETFWAHGYEGASIADLTTAMGITPQSLYAAFNSKADLYRAALEQYRALGSDTFSALGDPIDTVSAFERILRGSAAIFSAPEHPKGCMISTAVLNCASENAVIADHVAAMRRRSLDAFTARIERGIREGDMKSETNPRALARFLGAIIQGMSVQARDGASLEELLDIAVLAIAEVARHRA
ncbi:TetR/AcrR family transcriptional regulator [Rhizobium leguminosarum]|uniref:TetR/AcrR family transcriptional regulator n=1 Tax=Rhizobium leguminosarum TaxID=384 RepID=A0A4Q8XX10_RHILE|nr:TetR/AcrR family transcriptional regulator [Rhizobium leguminosarum]TAV47888.1 TetR/AcrR family transcriptional regulator [Rhizobium leguminosarum]TAV57468.1 TetR/AcrR family transcriptional regulator [Rhizobium leguminosarum]TAV68407.1 TetR/AcrR family transcriptional regulator [Rhizobium leguminosarum]TAX71402.1 TetR/AcrR family transcriptional regulator [Rhizobium leguminosarum]TAY66093.1 TetR/AcrR family transcriptional regulator [Rhizobium leguminosarum]